MKWFDLSRQWEKIEKEVKQKINKVLEHQQFLSGPEVTELEDLLTIKVGVTTVACHSGTDALVLALKAMNVQKGQGVLTTCFSFISTAEAICQVGAVPLFCDIDSKTFNLTVETLEIEYQKYKQGRGRISFTGPIVGVLAVNLFGVPCDYNQICHWSKKQNLFVIEDAAQSMGASLRGNPSGSLADIATTSFYPTKPLGSYGQGGAVFCKTKKQVEYIRSLIEHGFFKGQYRYLGINSRMDTIQAAILLVKLQYFEEEQVLRKKWVDRYFEYLPSSIVSFCDQDMESSWSIFSILIHKKEELERYLTQQKVPFQNYYSSLLSEQPIFRAMGYSKGEFKIAKKVCSEIINLPLYPDLTKEEQDFIIKVIVQKLT